MIKPAVTITPFARTIFARIVDAPFPPPLPSLFSSAFAVTIVSAEVRDDDFNASEIADAAFAVVVVTSFIAAIAARFDTLPTIFAFDIAATVIAAVSEPVAQTLALTATVVVTIRVTKPDKIKLTEVPSVLIVGITVIEILAPFDVVPVAIHEVDTPAVVDVTVGPSVRVTLPGITPADIATAFAQEFARLLATVLLTGVDPKGNDTVALACKVALTF